MAQNIQIGAVRHRLVHGNLVSPTGITQVLLQGRMSGMGAFTIIAYHCRDISYGEKTCLDSDCFSGWLYE